MDTILKFITILAYIGAVSGVLMGCFLTYLSWDYNQKINGHDSIDKILDRMQGYRKVYKPGKYWLIAVISIAWLFAM